MTFTTRSLTGAPTRTLLMLLAMSIGVAAVVVLTALGEGARRYVVSEFEQLGTHLLIMLPGRTETTGGIPPLLGETPQDLTLQDALALLRSRYITRIAPISVGGASVSRGSRDREVTVIGTTVDYFEIRKMGVGAGLPLPDIDPERTVNVAVLGAKLKRELFDGERALGQWIRIHDRRFRVVGILSDDGQSLGQDLGDMVVIPVAAAQNLFNAPSLFRVLIQARSEDDIPRAKSAARAIVSARHNGEDDVTIITQDAVLGTFDNILRALTYTVGGIASVSLAVAGILIMNVMLVSVSQRTAEIGLLKALGSPSRQILHIFLAESSLLAAIGATTGLLIGFTGIAALTYLFPEFPLAPPIWAPVAAVVVALGMGLLFGFMPARRAATLDPVKSLSGR